MVNAVIIGGNRHDQEPTRAAPSTWFAEHPDQWRLLAQRPELASGAVEECMRHFGAIRNVGRFASEDVVYRDVLFPAGTFVFPSLASANLADGVTADGATTFRQHPRAREGSGPDDVRLGDPLLPRSLPGTRRTPGGAAAARPTTPRSRRRRGDHVEAGHHGDLRTRPLPRHVLPPPPPDPVL